MQQRSSASVAATGGVLVSLSSNNNNNNTLPVDVTRRQSSLSTYTWKIWFVGSLVCACVTLTFSIMTTRFVTIQQQNLQLQQQIRQGKNLQEQDKLEYFNAGLPLLEKSFRKQNTQRYIPITKSDISNQQQRREEESVSSTVTATDTSNKSPISRLDIVENKQQLATYKIDSRIGSTTETDKIVNTAATIDNEIIHQTSKLSDSPNDDANCPFRNSPIYRKVYVYPNYGDVDHGWSGEILSEASRDWQINGMQAWPWLALQQMSQARGSSHYDIQCQHVQYATELLVRELMINPNSCLRTNNPEEATLFYVPYLPSVEHHRGENNVADYTQSPYGTAILDILDKQNYTGWETLFGLTSKYWKRRQGSDHILVFSEPLHGLSHPRSRRGNYHFKHTQKQLKPPIVISVELSTTFVKQYPKCSAKNILVPYPNTDGRWFNGKFARESLSLLVDRNINVTNSPAVLPAERILAQQQSRAQKLTTASSFDSINDPRPVAQYYSAGAHGTCKKLRTAMTHDYRSCSSSHSLLSRQFNTGQHGHSMRLATFCPCPGGDSPSAKRMFDSLIAGCIPVILSQDFVWPFTNEFDPDISLDPAVFSIRLSAKDYEDNLLQDNTCTPVNATRPGLQHFFEQTTPEQLQRLRQGVAKAKHLYSWYEPDPDLPDNPLKEGILPTGGTAHAVVNALAERASGARWPACEEELKTDRGPDAWKFLC